VRAIDSVRSGDEIELSQRNFYLNSIVSSTDVTEVLGSGPMTEVRAELGLCSPSTSTALL
ncbi:hypothetical protein, partial [Burkholderia ubonensis]|uniref:hypothetical protein n=1 Tax=Burkholderia ubonensis TaxID=101571 RepID=UPI001E513BC1